MIDKLKFYLKNYGLVKLIKQIILIFNTLYISKIICGLRGFKSFSQYYEDIFIYRTLKYKKTGVYVDIGANDPETLNNTKLFYEKGWRGINIEPNTYLLEKFTKNRLEDKNLNIGIGDTNSELKFYICNNHTLSTFSEQVSKKLEKDGYKITEKIIKAKRMEDVFNENNIKYIDFLSIDTEGFNFKILRSNNWDKFRPKLICIEDEERYGTMYDNYLKSKGYKKVGFNLLNIFFLDVKK